MNVGGKKMLVIIDMQNHILDPNSEFYESIKYFV